MKIIRNIPVASNLFIIIAFLLLPVRAMALCGDVSGDGQILSNDLLMVARASIGTLTLTAEQNARADCVVSGTENNPDSSIMSNDLLMVARASIGTTILKCSEGGSTFSGTASAPSGVSLGRSAGRTANATGLEAKSSVTVEVYYIDDDGAKSGNTLQKAITNSSGNYSFTLPASVAVASNLIIVAGAGDNRMRAIVTSTTVNINPTTEIVTSEIVANTQPLSNFTVSEIASIQTQAETDAAAVDLSAAVSVSAAVTTLNTGTLAANLDTSVSTASGSTSNAAVCGNSTVETGEQCDDGNTTIEVCTYGLTSCTVCNATCQSIVGAVSYCGDGVNNTADGEQCDDGNTVSSDGCSATCLTEADNSWAKTFGGLDTDEFAYSVQQTTDGGYIVAGVKGATNSYSLLGDAWVLKLDSSGNQVWSKTFAQTFEGLDTDDGAKSVQQTTDGGYIVAGFVSGGSGNPDFWVLKLDSSGNQVWAKTFGGLDDDRANSVQQTTDGGYIVAGYSVAYAGYYGAGESDFWVLKLNSSGNQVWAKTFGGLNYDEAASVQQTTDGGYIVAGSTYSGYRTGGYDFLLLKLDSSGNQVWSKTFGGLNTDEFAYSVQQTTDGGYVVAGESITYGLMVLKLDSSGNQVWSKTSWGLVWYSNGESVQQTTDGGYVVAGSTRAGSGFVLKLDSSGNQVWAKTFGETTEPYRAYSVQQTTDGGYVVAGQRNYSAGGQDAWVMKLDSSGACTGSGCP